MKKVLVTGGAGYKGTLLVEALLDRECAVTLLDNFMYGLENALGFSSHRNCTIVKKDIRNLERQDVEGYDIVYHLAAISGMPACQSNPHSAQTINVDSTQSLASLLDDDQVLVYASTTSIYGQSDEPQDENAQPRPPSLYAMTKYQAETICMRRANSIAFRFATLFGVSHKMRCDLLFNDFVFRAVTERNVVLFDEHSVRTFLHVRDAIRAYLMVLDQPQNLVGKIFNVGSHKMNFSKLELAQNIKQHLNIDIMNTSLPDTDRRDFIINYDRINALGFHITVGLDEGIRELVELYSWYRPFTHYQTI